VDNLAICPDSLIKLDANAPVVWPKLLKKVGVVISQGEHIEDSRAWTVRNFGLPSLLQRLCPGMTERERARVWWRESAACGPGDSVPDITAGNLNILNAWILDPEQKYPASRTSENAALNAFSCGRNVHSVDGLIADSPETPRQSLGNKALRGRPRTSDDEKRRNAADRQARWRERKAAQGQMAA
jgi:hypothetical protein